MRVHVLAVTMRCTSQMIDTVFTVTINTITAITARRRPSDATIGSSDPTIGCAATAHTSGITITAVTAGTSQRVTDT